MSMIRTLLSYVGQYKKDSILTPLFMVLEVTMEVLIPYVTASIIDDGIQAGNLSHVFAYGGLMVLLAFLSLTGGVLSARFGASASAGFARNIRAAMYEKVQTFSFSNIDKFSTAGLVTRMTTDVTNLQNAYMMILRIAVRAPLMLIFSFIMCFVIHARLALIFLGFMLLLALFVLIWVNDTGAYCVGSLTAKRPQGNHKMAPHVSPKKSWEGLIGGVVFTLAAAMVLYRYGWFDGLRAEHNGWSLALLFGLLTSVFGTLGDLMESLFKRSIGVKDSGRFLPGHGGVLDRFDSILFTAPAVFILASILAKL